MHAIFPLEKASHNWLLKTEDEFKNHPTTNTKQLLFWKTLHMEFSNINSHHEHYERLDILGENQSTKFEKDKWFLNGYERPMTLFESG